MSLSIRRMEPGDRDLWADMAHALWPEVLRDELRAEIEDLDGEGIGRSRGWVAEEAGRALGYAELGLRPYANGCDGRPVPFLEAIWVAPEARRRGVGRRLLAHLAGICRQEGYREIGSDALIDNSRSHAAHAAWGFAETERVIYFRMPLD